MRSLSESVYNEATSRVHATILLATDLLARLQSHPWLNKVSDALESMHLSRCTAPFPLHAATICRIATRRWRRSAIEDRRVRVFDRSPLLLHTRALSIRLGCPSSSGAVLSRRAHSHNHILPYLQLSLFTIDEIHFDSMDELLPALLFNVPTNPTAAAVRHRKHG